MLKKKAKSSTLTKNKREIRSKRKSVVKTEKHDENDTEKESSQLEFVDVEKDVDHNNSMDNTEKFQNKDLDDVKIKIEPGLEEIFKNDKASQTERFNFECSPNELEKDVLVLVDAVEKDELSKTMCRFCFQNEEVFDIFEKTYENHKLVELICILFTDSIPTTDPRLICRKCMDLLHKTYQFHKIYQRSLLILKRVLLNPDKIIENAKTETLINEDVETNSSDDESDDNNDEIIDNNSTKKCRLKGIVKCELCSYEVNVRTSTRVMDKHYLQKHALNMTNSLSKGDCLICKKEFNGHDIKNHFESKEHVDKSKICPICFKSLPTNIILTMHMKEHGLKSRNLKEFKKDFPCILCKVKFATYKEIEDHFDDHHSESKMCIICARVCKSQVKYHMSIHLPNSLGLVCRDCRISFDTPEQLVEHQTSDEHKNCFACKVCKTRCKDRKALLNHMLLHKSNRFVCDVCGHISADQLQFRKHSDTHLDKTFYCDKCPKSFKDIASLNFHRRRHDLICSTCQRICTYEWQLKLHQAQHDVPTSVICSVRKCHEIFPDKDKLNFHLQSAHQSHTCTTCKKDFYNFKNFQGHTSIHLWESLPDVDDPKTCKLCKQSFLTERTFFSHMYNMHKIFFCKVCRKIFYNNVKLKMHQVQEHDMKVPRNLSGVTRQNRTRIGSDDPRRTCEICLKQLASQASYYIHKKLHSGDKSFVCSHCGKSFARKYTKIIHERTHTGDKRFACSVCGRKFIQVGDKNKHEQRHFRDEGIEEASAKRVQKIEDNFENVGGEGHAACSIKSDPEIGYY